MLAIVIFQFKKINYSRARSGRGISSWFWLGSSFDCSWGWALFMCLLVIYMSLEKCVFGFFRHFKITYFELQTVLTSIWFPSIFSRSLTFSQFWWCSLEAQKWWVWCPFILFFCFLYFWCRISTYIFRWWTCLAEHLPFGYWCKYASSNPPEHLRCRLF